MFLQDLDKYLALREKEKDKTCPKCGCENRQATSCSKCGLIFNRYYTHQMKKALPNGSEKISISGITRFIGKIEKASLIYTLLIILTTGAIIWTYSPFFDGYSKIGTKTMNDSEDKTATSDPEGYTDNEGREFYRQGLIAGGRRDIIGASRNFEEALKYFRRLNDNRAVILTNLNLADCYRILNKNKEALHYFEKAHDLAINSGYEIYEAKALRGIGLIYYESDRYDMALSSLKKVFDINRRLDLKEAVSDCLIIGAIENEQDPDRAIAYFQMALDMLKSLDNNWFEQQTDRILHISSDGTGQTIRLTRVAPQFENL